MQNWTFAKSGEATARANTGFMATQAGHDPRNKITEVLESEIWMGIKLVSFRVDECVY